MDRNGRFITEAERDARVEDMKQVRLELLERLEEERRRELEGKAAIEAAREKDVREGRESQYKPSHHKPAKNGAL
jgi:DNA-directed RNA polymerase beta' subunit